MSLSNVQLLQQEAPVAESGIAPGWRRLGVFTAYISRWEYLIVVCVSSTQKLELYVPIFPCISSETPSLPLLVPTYPDQPSCVLKGWLYSLLLYDFTEPLLPAFEAQKSWVIPAVSPTLGRTWAGPTTGTLPPFSQTRLHSSCSVVQLKQFYIGSTDFQAISEAHTRPLVWTSWPGSICPG